MRNSYSETYKIDTEKIRFSNRKTSKVFVG